MQGSERALEQRRAQARRAAVKRIWSAAVAASDPAAVVRDAIDASEPDGLNVAGYTLSAARVWLIAIGKAAAAMEAGARAALGERVAGSIVIGKGPDRTAVQQASTAGRRYVQGSHPVPSEQSLEAGAAVLVFASAIPAGDGVLCLISGGGSALVEVLRPGIALEDLQGLTRALLASGATIQEMNAVRGRLSQIKAGGLRQALAHTQAMSLVVSDVLGNDPASIASGLTASPSRLSAEEVLTRYGIAQDLPALYPAADDVEHPFIVLADISTAIDAAQQQALLEGYEPLVLQRDVVGEASDIGARLSQVCCEHTTDAPLQQCLLAGGETTVTIAEAVDGPGGRNCEAALAAALHLSRPDVSIGFLATDGDDGTTGAAGAIVDSSTVPTELRARAEAALAAHEAYTFLRERGALWSPGMSGTNVNDLVIALTGAPALSKD